MTDDTESADSVSEPTPSGPDDILLRQLTDIEQMAKEAASVLAAIQARADEIAKKSEDIENGRVHAETCCKQIDSHASAIAEQLASCRTQADSLKTDLEEARALKEGASSTAADLAVEKSKAEELVQQLRTHVSSAAEESAHIRELRTEVDAEQEAIALKSQHIEDARKHADNVRAEIDAAVAAANHSASQAETHSASAKNTDEAALALHVEIVSIRDACDENSDAISGLLSQCREHASITKALADLANTIEARVSAYESRLAEIEARAAEDSRTIEGLLPGATSAGLASAFNTRRERFRVPQRNWQFIFVFSVLALLGVAALEFLLLPTSEGPLTWDRLMLSFLHRLPFALPFIWLAIHASHRAALAQRVEEDYAFKETVSRSFEGYRREMAELEGRAAQGSALWRFCDGVLAIITNPPGRIYEKHPLNQTPLTAAAESAGPLADVLSKAHSPAADLTKVAAGMVGAVAGAAADAAIRGPTEKS